MDPVDRWASPSLREVGVQLLGGAQPQYAVAAALGGDRGNVARRLRQMTELGLLREERPDADGQPRWALADGQETPLRAALAAGQPVGRLVPGQVALLVAVPASKQAAFAAALRPSALTGAVIWSARVEGAEGQHLLVLDREAGPLASDAIVAALAAKGMTCSRLRVEDVMAGEEMRRRAAALRHVARR